MNELEPTARDLPTEREQESSDNPIPIDGKILHIASDTEDFDYPGLLGKVVQYVSMQDIISKIKEGTQYVVQIPTEFQEALDAGDMFIMQNKKTGVKRPILMKIAEDGRQQVVMPLPIVEQEFIQGNPVQDLADGYQNILMQKKMEQLTAKIDDIFQVVKEIEHGQMDDRNGLLEAGKNGLQLALKMPEGEERTMQINSSRQNLMVAQGQIGQVLQRRVTEFKSIPKHAAVRFMRELAPGGYIERKDQQVTEMQEYYDLYLQSTKYIAASYAICGDLKTAEESFVIAEKFIASIDFKKVQSIGYAHKQQSDMFYSAPVEYITAEKDLCLEEAKAYDYVALEVSGEKLLEVLDNGQEETFSETNTEQK